SMVNALAQSAPRCRRGSPAAPLSPYRRLPRAFRLCRKPDDMVRAAALCGGAHAYFVDNEAGVAKPPGKRAIGPRRPDREHAAPAQRAVDRLQSLRMIERIIGFADQRFGAVIDIEQDCIERR